MGMAFAAFSAMVVIVKSAQPNYVYATYYYILLKHVRDRSSKDFSANYNSLGISGLTTKDLVSACCCTTSGVVYRSSIYYYSIMISIVVAIQQSMREFTG
jgi:hypothetical protein